MNSTISTLIAIQSKDLQMARLSENLRRLEVQRQKIEATLAVEEKAEGEAREKFNALRRLSQERSAEVDDLDTQIRKYQKQLDDGLVSFKEMESMREQIEHGRERMENLEEEAIALLDQAESEAVSLKEREASYQQWKTRIAEELRELDEAKAQTSQKWEAECAEREKLAEQADPAGLAKYQALKKRVENPIVPVRDGRCSGCSLPLSQTTLERVREGFELVACENCGRIVYL